MTGVSPNRVARNPAYECDYLAGSQRLAAGLPPHQSVCVGVEQLAAIHGAVASRDPCGDALNDHGGLEAGAGPGQVSRASAPLSIHGDQRAHQPPFATGPHRPAGHNRESLSLERRELRPRWQQLTCPSQRSVGQRPVGTVRRLRGGL